MNKIVDEVLRRVSPSPEEEKKLHRTVGRLKAAIDEKKPPGVESMLVGSVAKGTYLRDALDIDFFLIFPPEYRREQLADITITLGKQILEQWMVQYAEHPYIRGYYEGYQTDIVPCYRVKSAREKLSAVDRTPFHTAYIIRHLKEEQKNEVRLLKQFLRGIGCYGAEAKTEGFSGYLTELMVLKYGTFAGVLEASQKWGRKVVLYLEEERQQFDERFVFVDPVDASRNVAAALSMEKLEMFITAAREFLREPKITFFFPNPAAPIPDATLKEKLRNFIGIVFTPPPIPDDILYPQLRKAASHLATVLEQHDFHVIDTTWYADGEAFIAIHLERLILDEVKLHMGPPVTEHEHAESFVEKWRHSPHAVQKPFEKDGRWWVKIKREHVSAVDVIAHHLNDTNLGKNLNECKNGMRIYEGAQLVEFREHWYEYFSDKYPWER